MASVFWCGMYEWSVVAEFYPQLTLPVKVELIAMRLSIPTEMV
jgi:hypothetical protein